MCQKYTEEELNTMNHDAKNAVIYQMQERLDKLEHDYERLIEQIHLADQERFGRHTEKLSEIAGQLSFFNEVEACYDENANEPAIEAVVDSALKKPRKPKQKGQREEDLKDFPQEVIPHDVSRQKLIDTFGEGNYKSMPDDICWQLRFEPGKWIAEKHVIKVYVGTDGLHQDEFLRGDHPRTLFRGSIATASLEAAIINAKYVNSNPLDRLSRDFKANGLNLSKQTMSNWTVWSAERYFRPVYDLMISTQLQAHVNQCDETTLEVIHDGRPAGSTSYMWVHLTGELSPVPKIIVYEYQKTRASTWPKLFLGNFDGYLQTDGYAGYNNVKNAKRFYCLAHIRRKFYDIVINLNDEALKKSRAKIGLNYCEKIYSLEKKIKEDFSKEKNFYETRQKVRQEKLKPLLEDFQKYIDEEIPNALPKSALGKALDYTKNLLPAMNYVLEDGELEIDNNSAERAIKPFVIGRKNWLFSNTAKGANSSAIIYSIIETAKANGLKVEKYLVYLMDFMNNKDIKDKNCLADAMPWSKKISDDLKIKVEH